MDLLPYCGRAPIPAEIWSRWNPDHRLLAFATLFASAHFLILCVLEPERLRSKVWLWAAGWGALVLLFVSPLCPLTSALFSARVTHHVLLVGLVPPLLIACLPDRLRAFTVPSERIALLLPLHIALMWFWHAPSPYSQAVASYSIYWASELTLLGSALLLWYALLSNTVHPGAVFGSCLAMIGQMGLLGAVITFARAPIYSPHFATTEPWGLTALSDQQLAGLIMWIPSAIPYVIFGLMQVGARLGPGGPEIVACRAP